MSVKTLKSLMLGKFCMLYFIIEISLNWEYASIIIIIENFTLNNCDRLATYAQKTCKQPNTGMHDNLHELSHI